MNGMSLAALLGAATWFGLDEARETVAESEAAPEAKAEAPGGRPAEPDFLWAPNPLFQ